jgi:hypothetical protein
VRKNEKHQTVKSTFAKQPGVLSRTSAFQPERVASSTRHTRNTQSEEMACIASFQALSLAPARIAGAAKSLKASSSKSFAGASLRATQPVRCVRAAAAGGLRVEARFDAGVGVFGNKAGMTQLFTEEGLCVPVTVIAIQAGNVVTQVQKSSRDFYVGADANERVFLLWTSRATLV